MFRVGKSLFGADEFGGVSFVGRKPYFEVKRANEYMLQALDLNINYTDNILMFLDRVKFIFEQKNTVLSGLKANVKIKNKRIVFSSLPAQEK
jgi:hypothetical protein